MWGSKLYSVPLLMPFLMTLEQMQTQVRSAGLCTSVLTMNKVLPTCKQSVSRRLLSTWWLSANVKQYRATRTREQIIKSNIWSPRRQALSLMSQLVMQYYKWDRESERRRGRVLSFRDATTRAKHRLSTPPPRVPLKHRHLLLFTTAVIKTLLRYASVFMSELYLYFYLIIFLISIYLTAKSLQQVVK